MPDLLSLDIFSMLDVMTIGTPESGEGEIEVLELEGFFNTHQILVNSESGLFEGQRLVYMVGHYLISKAEDGSWRGKQFLAEVGDE